MRPHPPENPVSSPTDFSSQEENFAAALRSIGGVADRATVSRTQRRVRERMLDIEERRRRARHGIGLAILGFSLLLLLLTPVLWSGFHLQLEEGWRGFTGVDMQSMYVLGWLFPVTMIGIILACLGMRAGRGCRVETRRIDQRIGSRLDSLVR